MHIHTTKNWFVCTNPTFIWSTAVTLLIFAQQKCTFKVWDAFTVKAEVLPKLCNGSTGRCWEVCSNCRRGPHSQCVHRCYYHKCYFKRRDEKENTWLWAPGLCSRALPVQSLLQSSSGSLAGVGGRGSQSSVQTGSSALPLSPAPPTLLCASPVPCPQTPPLKSQIPEIPQPAQERYSRALLFLLSRPSAYLDVSAQNLLL